MELDALTFNRLLRDALCMELAQTEKGQEYLEECWTLQQTAPDLQTLRERFK